MFSGVPNLFQFIGYVNVSYFTYHAIYVYISQLYTILYKLQFLWCIIHIQASWTLRSDLITAYVIRLIHYMNSHKYTTAIPVYDEKLNGSGDTTFPFHQGFSSSYFNRVTGWFICIYTVLICCLCDVYIILLLQHIHTNLLTHIFTNIRLYTYTPAPIYRGQGLYVAGVRLPVPLAQQQVGAA